MKHISFLWPPLEPALSILNFSLLCLKKKVFKKKELIKTKETCHEREHKISKNVILK